MRQAIIDLGTNTFKILVIEKDENNKIQILYKTKMPIGFSASANTGRISVAGFIRGVNALKAFKTNIIEYYQVEKTIAFATAGLRSTANGQEFVEYIEKELDMKIEIISGDREAQLIYEGIKMAVPLSDENVLMMDIGGGSTEFIIGNKNKIEFTESLKLGAGRLTEKFKPSDPILPHEIESMCLFIANQTENVITKAKEYNIKTLVGSSGSFNTLARVAAARFSTSEKYREKLYFEFTPTQFFEMHQLILGTKLHERAKIEGIKLIRNDIIVAASVLINYVLNHLQIERIQQSQYSLVEGVLSLINE